MLKISQFYFKLFSNISQIFKNFLEKHVANYATYLTYVAKFGLTFL